jgi:hypothetical protein
MNRRKHGIMGLPLRVTSIVALLAMFATCTLEGDIKTVREKMEGKEDDWVGSPNAPTGVTAWATSSSSITVSWNAVSGATGYNVYRSSNASSAYNYIGNAYSGTSYTNGGLSANTTYYYRVTAYNSYGNSLQSAYASATTSSSGSGSGSGTESNPISLTINTWADGSITSSTSGNAVWYSFNVTSGTAYYVWWNDGYAGDNTKTLDAKVSGYYGNGSSIFLNTDSGWSTPAQFTASSTSSTVKIKVEPYSSSYTGTFAVAYSTSSTRPGSGSGSPVDVPGANLATKLSWLSSNAQSGGNYIVEVSANESISPTTLSYSGRSNITITLRGNSSTRTVSLSSNGSMFSVGSGVTLVLDNNITLQGRSSNNSSLVRVSGTLIMNAGSRITGNTSEYGSGVYVAGGAFTMNGGTISGNIASEYGGGVSVFGTFTMSGGTISGNTASYDGGGVHAEYGTFIFTMSGGTISGNTASYDGGGVFVEDGSFIMSGGTISGNTASSSGGGVCVDSEATFTKTGGTIYGYSTSDTANSNAVKTSSGAVVNNKGHAVYAYISSSSNKRKETTAGPSVNLSFDGSGSSPTYSGSWDN